MRLNSWFIFFILACLAKTSVAHEVRPAYLKLVQQSSESGLEFTASFRQPQVDGRFLGLAVETNCESELTGSTISEGALTDNALLSCDENGLEYLEIVGLDRTLIDTLVSISWLDQPRTERLITARQIRLELASDAPTVPVYFSIGLTHLLLGFDHILFVLMLLYLVRKPMMIFWVVSSFTIAHSITLALSAFNLVSVSQGAVEAVIAASIVLLAYENLQTEKSQSHRYPILISFGFGLLHGLGFAGALNEIGLPEQSQLPALLFFNLGIEVGQIAIVVVVLGALSLLTFKVAKWVSTIPIYIVGGIACFWFIQRSWIIIAPALG